AASASGKLVALDFGKGTNDRNFEVWDSAGHKLFWDIYLGDYRWEKEMLIYNFPAKRLDINFNDKTRKCRKIGAAWLVYQKRYPHPQERGDTADYPSEIRCSK